MIKKSLLIAIAFMVLLPVQAFASTMSGEYYPPADSDYYLKKFSWKLYFDFDTYKVKITQYDMADNVKWEKTWNTKQNAFMWVDMKCQGTTSFEFLDQNGNSLGFSTRGASTTYVDDSACDYGSPVQPSDYNETEQKYKSDTFGGTQSKLSTPATNDGSGGTGSTGYDGVDDGTGTGTDPGTGGGTDPGTGGGGTDPGTGGDGSGTGTCDSCGFLDCPGWADYMGKLDGIKAAIPPAPNWDEVAKKFRDTIVPSMVSDMGDMLGSAPTPTTSKPQLPSTSDGGIRQNVPQGSEAPGLGDSSFSEGDIKDAAPTIPFREDPTGGFDLLQNPIESLPDLPTDDFPVPGSTDPGGWGENKPQQPELSYPDDPKDSGDVDLGNPPFPGDSAATPPSPGDSNNSAPVPGDNGATPPTPDGDSGMNGTKYYKPSPDAPDGSGGG